MISGLSDYHSAVRGVGAFEALSIRMNSSPYVSNRDAGEPGRNVDTALTFAGGLSSIVKAPVKIMTKQPDLIGDGFMDFGTGALDVYKTHEFVESER